MAEKSNLAGSVGVTVFFCVYWDQHQQLTTEISLFQDISRYKPILTGLLVVIKGQNPRNDVEVIKFFDCDGQNVRTQ